MSTVITNKAAGFTRFQCLAAVVFVVSLAGFMSMHYLPADSDSAVGVSEPASMATADADADAAGVSQPGALAVNSNNDSSSDSGIKAILARFFSGEEVSVSDDLYLPKPMSDAEHAAWAETFQAQLYSPEPVVESQEEESVPVISGRVLTEYGAPVEGIEVTASFRDYFKTADSIARKNAAGTQTTTTNENGFYAFRGLPAGIYMIGTPDSGNYAPSRVEVRTDVKYADLVLNAQRHAQVRGVVTDPMGTEIGGVRIMPLVKGIPDGDVSDDNGEFGFAVALHAQKRSFPVRFQRKGYREQRYGVTEDDWSEDGQLMLAVTMEPVYEFSSMSGSVKGTDGTQVSGETVRLYSQSLKRNYRAVVNDAGEFRFPKVEIADDYQLGVRPSGPYRDYAEQNVELTAGDLWHDIELDPLNRDYRLSGRILDQRGKPVPDFTLTLRSKSASGQKLEVTSDRYGRYEVANVPEGELVFESRTMPYYTVSGVQLSGNDTDHDLDLVVNRGKHKLLGKVVDSSGRPIASPRIFITASTTVNGLRSQSSSSTSADFDGRFLFTELGAGEHTVTVNAPGFEGVRLKPDVGRQKEVVVELEKSST